MHEIYETPLSFVLHECRAQVFAEQRSAVTDFSIAYLLRETGEGTCKEIDNLPRIGLKLASDAVAVTNTMTLFSYSLKRFLIYII